MAMSKVKKPSVAQVLKLVDQLSLKEKSKLSNALLEELEDKQDVRIALYRLKHPGKRWSHKEIKRQISLAD